MSQEAVDAKLSLWRAQNQERDRVEGMRVHLDETLDALTVIRQAAAELLNPSFNWPETHAVARRMENVAVDLQIEVERIRAATPDLPFYLVPPAEEPTS